MFENIKNNLIMIEGAYKKIKSLYFYSKDKQYERLKIGKFEENDKVMQSTFNKLAEYLAQPENPSSVEYIDFLISKVDYYIFPKTFESYDSKEKNSTITNVVNNKNLTKVNFLINLPIELMLLDCLWTLLIGKIAYDNNSINQNNYANTLQTDKIYKSSPDLFDGIDYSSNRLFKPYFKQYSTWRNRALQIVEVEYEHKRNTALISLDLKGYFYSVNFKFESIKDLLNHDARLESLNFLTNVIEKICLEYTQNIRCVRDGITANSNEKETIFPFQMCSTNLLANIFLQDFDKKINSIEGLLYYGRYRRYYYGNKERRENNFAKSFIRFILG